MVRSRAVARTWCGLAVGAVLTLGAPDSHAQPVTVAAGVNVRAAAGTFGSDQTTTLVYVPANLRIDVGRLETSFSLPFLGIRDGTVAWSQGGFVPMQGSLTSAPGVGMSMSAGGMGGMMSGGSVTPGTSGTPGVAPGSTVSGALPPSLLTNEYGLGDIVGSIGYRVADRALTRVQVIVGTRFKIPTASSTSGLGTGKADIGALAGIRKQFDRGWVYAEGGYLRIGSPAGVDLRDAAFWYVGAGRPLSTRTSFLASVAGNTAILPEFGAPLEVGAGVGIRAGERLTLTLIPTVGLTKASPRIAITFGLSQLVLQR